MFAGLALVVAAGLLGPLLGAGRRPLIPVLLGELIAGILVGRTGLRLLDPAAQPFPAFFILGFAMLMLGAGSEVDLRSAQLRKGVSRGILAVALTVGAGVPVGLLISSVLGIGRPLMLVVLLAGSSAAVVFPTVQERTLTGSSIAMLLAWVALADALTVLLLPLTLSSAQSVPAALAGDVLMVLVSVAVIVVGERARSQPVVLEAERESTQRRWALRLRLAVLMLFVLGAIADRTGGSLLVAGFAAGIVLRRFGTPERLALQLAGLAEGFFVPAFFVLLGATLNLREFTAEPAALGLTMAMAAGAVLVHQLAALFAAPQQRVATGLSASAQLGLPAAAAALGLSTHALSPALGAALVAAGCLTLLPSTLGAILMRPQVATSPATR